MNVAFQGTIDFGGQGRFTVELVRALAPLCDEITVYPTAVSVEDPSEHVWWTDMPANVDLAPKRGLIEGAIRDAKAFPAHDVVHVNYAILGLPSLLSTTFDDTPYVYTVHGFGPAREMVHGKVDAAKWWVDHQILPMVARRGEFVTVSRFNRELIRRRCGLDPAVIYHGIDRERFGDVDAAGIREEYGIDPDAAMLLFVGRFLKYKDLGTLLSAFSLISRAHDDVELVLAGGSDDGFVGRRIRKLGIQDEVTIISDVSDDVIERLAASATVFTSASYREGFGFVFLEAMASGLPIVYANAGAAPEVVGDAGVSVPPRDPHAFANATLSILRDEELRDRLRRIARRRVQRFTWESAAREYADLYRQLTDRRVTPRP